jgi:hypothetical protein
MIYRLKITFFNMKMGKLIAKSVTGPPNKFKVTLTFFIPWPLQQHVGAASAAKK